MDKDLCLQCGNFIVPKPQLYCGKPPSDVVKSVFESDEWIAQEKRDGSFFQLIVNEAGDVGLFSRTVSKTNGEYVNRIDNVPHIKEWAESCLPKDTVLVGEICFPGSKSNLVTKVMGALPQKAIERQFESDKFGGPMHYYIFDCVRWNGEDWCNNSTYMRLDDMSDNLLDMVKDEKYIEVAEVYTDNFEEHLRNIFAASGEGMVFKKKDSVYRPGKRSTVKQMFKYKEHLDSLDVVVMDCLDPEKEYTGKELDSWPYWIGGKPVTKPYYNGWKNAFKIGVYKDGSLTPIGRVASGLDDSMREQMGKRPQDFIGRVIQISCMSVDPAASTIRHPVYECFREDKPATDCLWEDIFNV